MCIKSRGGVGSRLMDKKERARCGIVLFQGKVIKKFNY